MKKVLFAAIFAVIGIMAQAQAFVGGTFGIATEKSSNTDRYTTFTIAPTVGYNLSEKFAIGVEFAYGYADQSSVSINVFNVGPYARYYFAEAGNFKFFGDAAVYFASVKMTDFDAVNGWGIAVSPGVSCMLGKNWQVLAKMNFFQYEHFDGENATSFGINPTNVQLGIAYNF